MSEARRSIRLRLALASAALIAGSAGLVLGGVYLWTIESLEREVDESLTSELSELVDRYARGGGAGFPDEIRRRSQRREPVDEIYVLAESHYERIEGNLPAWPLGLENDEEARTVAVEYRVSEVRVTRHVRAASRTLADGRHLLVGRDVSDHTRFQRVMRGGIIVAFGLTLLLAVAAGLAISRNLLRRVEDMNETILRMLGGRTHERVAVAGGGDEFDRLAGHFNRLLEENDRLVERVRGVTNDIAHDLRTPLARMRGHIESALATPPDAERSRARLEELLAETNGVLDTFNALLQISQIESGTIREQMERLDLASLVEGAVDLYQPLADEAGLELSAETEPGHTVRGDRHLLAQALANLIDNAIKYGEGPGRVAIRTRSAGEHVVLEVADRGPGIPPDERERVLERFARLDASRHLPGTGLGLSFVRAVADLHEVRLELTDNEPGLRVKLIFPDAS